MHNTKIVSYLWNDFVSISDVEKRAKKGIRILWHFKIFLNLILENLKHMPKRHSLNFGDYLHLLQFLDDVLDINTASNVLFWPLIPYAR